MHQGTTSTGTPVWTYGESSSGIPAGGSARELWPTTNPARLHYSQKHKGVRTSRPYSSHPNRHYLGGLYGSPFVKYSELEKKFHDVSMDDSTTSDNWEVTTSMNLIAQGAQRSQRIGRKIMITSIHAHGRFYLNAQGDVTSVAGGHHCKIYLLLDTQCNGANPTTAQVFTTTNDINSFLNLHNGERFKILWKHQDTVQPTAGGSAATGADYNGEAKIWEMHQQVNIPIYYDSTTGAITEIKSNNLFWAYCRSASTGTVSFIWTTRIRFIDL